MSIIWTSGHGGMFWIVHMIHIFFRERTFKNTTQIILHSASLPAKPSKFTESSQDTFWFICLNTWLNWGLKIRKLPGSKCMLGTELGEKSWSRFLVVISDSLLVFLSLLSFRNTLSGCHIHIKGIECETTLLLRMVWRPMPLPLKNFYLFCKWKCVNYYIICGIISLADKVHLPVL